MKYIKLNGRALALAESVAKDLRSTKEEMENIMHIAQVQCGKLQAALNLRIKDGMRNLFDELGVPPELRGGFNVNSTYMDTRDMYVMAETEEAEKHLAGRVPEGMTLH